jgi:Ca2+-dependent lipid-binding protein
MDMNAHSEVELRFSCSNLPNMDVMSKTDAFVVIYLQNSQGIIELGRTEVVYDNLNPEFSKGVHLTYHFEEIQTIILKVYDEDSKGIQDLNKHDYIGECAFHLGSLMSSYGQSLSYNLKGPKGGQIKVFAEEIAACNDYLIASFAGHKLKNTDGWFAKSDPFIVIRKIREDNQFVQVWKSEVVKNNLNPQWKPSNISVQVLCNGDYDRPLRLEIYDWDNDGTTTYMGGLQTSLRQILEVGKTKGQFNVIEEKKTTKEEKLPKLRYIRSKSCTNYSYSKLS